MRSPVLLATAALLLSACSTDAPLTPQALNLDSDAYRGQSGDVYDVTITNLTTSQPLSPVLVATHGNQLALFTAGTTASEGIRAIAEEGNASVAAAALAGNPAVENVAVSAAPVHRIGGPGHNAVTVRVNSGPGARFLSIATMLICTNDGFAAVDRFKLPNSDLPAMTYAYAYDAGTEVNTEAGGDIVPPCFFMGPVGGQGGGGRTAEYGVIGMHPGITGGAALTSAHAWNGPIARITIQRVAGR